MEGAIFPEGAIFLEGTNFFAEGGIREVGILREGTVGRWAGRREFFYRARYRRGRYYYRSYHRGR